MTTSINFFLNHYPDFDTNHYVTELPLHQRIYIKYAMKKKLWIIKLVSYYKTR